MRAARLAGLAFDLAVLWAVGVIRGWAQWRGPPSVALPGLEQVPARAWTQLSLTDALLMGPDAGNWAANARAWLEGQPLDPNRLPVYTLLTARASRPLGDIALAGHAVNHLASLLLPCVLYALGRLLGGRGAGLVAALLAALSPALINTKNHFGVDPVLHLSTWAFLGAGLLASRRGPGLALLAGLLGGVCMSTHYLGLLFPLPVAAFVAVGQPGLARAVLAPALLLGAAGGTFALLTAPYPSLDLGLVASVYAEGVAGSGAGGGVSGTPLGAAVAFVQERLPGALRMAVQRGLSALHGPPWALLLGLFWVGVLGPVRVAPEAPRWRRLLDPWSAAWMGGLLAPFVLMEAARAPQRYTLLGLPLFFLAVGRGLAALGALADGGLARRWPRWPSGLLAVVAGLALVMASAEPMRLRWPGIPPTEEGVQDRVLGGIIAEAFPAEAPRAGIVTSSQSLAFYTRRLRCPARPCATQDALDVPRCAAQLLAQCPGSGPLPYVVEARDQHGFADKPHEAMDAAVAARFERVGGLEGAARRLDVYRVTREGLEAMATVDGQRLEAPALPPR